MNNSVASLTRRRALRLTPGRMRRPPSLLRACCFFLAFGLVLSGGQALGAHGASNNKRKGGSSGDTSSASGSLPGKKRTEPHAPKIKLDSTETAAGSANTATSSAPPSRGPTRIDFDDRLIQGQTNKSGAVYLYERKELKTRSMIKMRDSFRDETVGNVYDG